MSRLIYMNIAQRIAKREKEGNLEWNIKANIRNKFSFPALNEMPRLPIIQILA